MLNLLSSIIEFVRMLLKNMITYGLRGAVLVAISSAFRLLSGWALTGLAQIVLQIVIMGTALYFMDTLVNWIFAETATAAQQQ